MTTPDSKPKTIKILNSKLLPIAAILLIVLALLFMATPLLRSSRTFQRNSTFTRQGSGQPFPQNGFQGNGQTGQGFQGQGNNPQSGQGFSNQDNGSQPDFTNPGNGLQPGQNFRQGLGGANSTGRQLLLGTGFLTGRTGPIIYLVALLIALAAAVGMFMVKRWGQILGIVMAALYFLIGLVSLLPTLLFFNSAALRNPLSLILGLIHILLAVAVIVFAVIPAKKPAVPVDVPAPLESA
jgi:hypothetical protein